nr:MAG TPA: hypothetical protein [Caudoviricetes sp.]
MTTVFHLSHQAYSSVWWKYQKLEYTGDNRHTCSTWTTQGRQYIRNTRSSPFHKVHGHILCFLQSHWRLSAWRQFYLLCPFS